AAPGACNAPLHQGSRVEHDTVFAEALLPAHAEDDCGVNTVERATVFPAGARQTAVPSLFFSEVLPRIDDPAELIVSIYAFYLLGRRPAAGRGFAEEELRAEPPLRRALARLEEGPAAALERGLEAAVERGTVLRAETMRDGRPLRLYAANVPGAA